MMCLRSCCYRQQSEVTVVVVIVIIPLVECGLNHLNCHQTLQPWTAAFIVSEPPLKFELAYTAAASNVTYSDIKTVRLSVAFAAPLK